LKFRHTIALLGAIMVAAAAPASALTVRVEGKTKTLLRATPVHLHSGWITKDGVKKGLCSARTAIGALDTATHHRWSGKFYSSFSDYLVEGILGQKYGTKATSFWGFFVNGRFSQSGVCAYKPRAGDQVLFAAVSTTDTQDYTLAIAKAPRTATAGHAFTVKVDYVNAAGKKVPLSGARVSGTDFAAVTTNAKGKATITPIKTGTLTLGASHAPRKQGTSKFGYVRAAKVTVHVG
jgi:hypothetical protein